MADSDNMLLYTAVYDSVDDAVADLEGLEELHRASMLGKFDAAVIDKRNGEPHIAQRIDRPRVRVIPEWLNAGTLPGKQLKNAAQQLSEGQAALIVAGEPTLEAGFDKAVTKARKIVKRSLDATTDEMAQELQEAAKSS